MPTRIDIELTSVSGDGSWTWRAAGAREPKGVLDGSILPTGAAVGDQLRAESEQSVEGIRILSIVPPKQKAERNDRPRTAAEYRLRAGDPTAGGT